MYYCIYFSLPVVFYVHRIPARGGVVPLPVPVPDPDPVPDLEPDPVPVPVPVPVPGVKDLFTFKEDEIPSDNDPRDGLSEPGPLE